MIQHEPWAEFMHDGSRLQVVPVMLGDAASLQPCCGCVAEHNDVLCHELPPCHNPEVIYRLMYSPKGMPALAD